MIGAKLGLVTRYNISSHGIRKLHLKSIGGLATVSRAVPVYNVSNVTTHVTLLFAISLVSVDSKMLIKTFVRLIVYSL